MKIPVGWCQCGCGNKTNIVPPDGTWKKMGRIAGQPFSKIMGHGKKRHWDKYEIDHLTGCWNWTGPLCRAGYAKSIQIGGRGAKIEKPHKYFYMVLIGPVQEGLQLDHLCRNRKCVNPLHLEPVTPTENNRRKPSLKLNISKVEEIRSMVSSGVSNSAIAGKFGISQATVCDIKAGRRWR